MGPCVQVLLSPCRALLPVSPHSSGAARNSKRAIALCRQLQELRVALGWKERFAMGSAYFVVDMGVRTLKVRPAPALREQYVGIDNTPQSLPAMPVQYAARATVYHAYLRDLHLRCLFFDMLDMQAAPHSFATAPGSVEYLLGRACPFLACVSVSGEWLDTRRTKPHVRPPSDGAGALVQPRFFHVRSALMPHAASSLSSHRTARRMRARAPALMRRLHNSRGAQLPDASRSLLRSW